jgi:hypothetical protein
VYTCLLFRNKNLVEKRGLKRWTEKEGILGGQK